MSKPYRPGFLKRMWNYYRNVKPLQSRTKEICVGTDRNGNKYFLRSADPNRKTIKEYRLVIPPSLEREHELKNMGYGVPQEWDEWLRKRRKDPPTDEEIGRNEQKKQIMQERIKEIARKERLEEVEAVEDDSAITKTVEGDTTKSPFPVYEEFELNPGVPKPNYLKRK